MAIVWERTAGCLSRVVDQLPSDARIRGLSIAGQGDGCWLVDEAGEPVRNAILWSDSRAADYVDAWSETGVHKDIERICGSGLFPGTVLPLLTWLDDEEPDRLAAAATLFFCKDWLAYKLTDQRATELSDASLPLLDIRTQSYSDAVFEYTDLAAYTDLRPPLVEAGSIVGSVRETAAAATDLPVGTPVVAGLFDVGASALGCGAISSGESVSSIGTSVVNQSITATPSINASGVQIALWENLYTEAVGSNAGTRSIEWVRDELLGGPGTPYTELEERAHSVPIGAAGVTYLPYLSATGERGPFVDPNARAQLLGLDPIHTTDHIVRAVYEGLALALRHCYEALPTTATTLFLTGGPTRSAFWNQLVADCMDVDILVPIDTEITATGVALLAGVGTDVYSDVETGIEHALSSPTRYRPDQQRVEQYDKLYEQYTALLDRMAEVWRMQAETRDQLSNQSDR